MPRAEIDETTVATLSDLADLGLSPERCKVVAPALNGMLPMFDAFDAADIGETPPAHTYDARWRERS